MKILIGSDVSIAKVLGGAERFLYEQSTRFVQRGHSVHILTRRLPYHRDDHEMIDGVYEWRYEVDVTSPLSFIWSTMVNGKYQCESIFNHHSFDIINFHQPFTALAMLRSPRSRFIPKIYTCHSLSFEEYISRNPQPKGFASSFFHYLNVVGRRWIEGRALDQSDHIIVLSNFSRDKLEVHHHISPTKIYIIPGGVNLNRFHPASNKIFIRQSLNLPEDKLILLTIRNLEPRMGLDNFILSLPDVVNTLKDILVIIGGDGPLMGYLKSISRDLGLDNVVSFTGFIPEMKLPDYYRAADLFILPTLELEGFGLVTVEALASGLPVLGTPVGGTLDILERFDRRFLFDDTSSEAMAKRIIEFGRQFIDNPELARSTSLKCRAYAENNYSWEKNVDLLENLFKSICKR